MRLEQIFVGKAIDVTFHDKIVKTGIFKHPVDGPVRVGKTTIEGDQQADLTVHGGIDKAVYAYPVQHYTYWRHERSDLEFSPGIFGENLSVSGLDETVGIGDVFQIGQVVLQVTIPRMPCYKLGIKMNDAAFVKDFMKAEKNGFYLKVLTEGLMEGGNSIKKLSSDDYGLTIAEVIRLYTSQRSDKALLKKAIDSPSLSEDWKDYFEVQLRKLTS